MGIGVGLSGIAVVTVRFTFRTVGGGPDARRMTPGE